MNLFGKLIKKKTEEPVTMEPVTMQFEGIPFIVIRRRVKYSRVEFKRSGLRVIVPRGIDPLKVLEVNKISILKKYHKIISQVETARQIALKKWTETQFNMIVTSYVERYSRLLKVRAKEIRFRKMKRRWGSCRSDGTITLNRYLQFVPEPLIAYIVYHELAHLVVHAHDRRFKRLIVLEFPNYRQLDKELNVYGLKLLS